MSSQTRCATHPEVETSLRCSKCGKPICPRCMVQTPVGARCRECAQVRRSPIYQVSLGYYLRAVVVALGMALATGILWSFIWRVLFFSLLNIILAAGVGYGIGEVIGLSVNRKRGRGLQLIAGVAVFLSYVVRNAFLA
ncbi:MAG: B-box zinc finger protein, partial [Dehalococcoidia bacterium]